jgi:ribosomal protein S18 acetylase RimI-like enzyme
MTDGGAAPRKTIEVRRLGGDETALLRDVRLRALGDAPEAFATTLAEARAWPPERWAEIARGFNVVALDGERGAGVGLVSGWLLESGNAWLARLWVAPEARGAGVGLRMIEAVADWAHERGAPALELSVTANNPGAAAFYARAGFAETGRRRPLPADPSRTEVFLRRPL